jgi:hypothetical protein
MTARMIREITMIKKAMSFGHGEIDVLIVQALVRKLVAKGVLSPDDVRSLLLDAAKGLDLVGSELTAEAAHIIVRRKEVDFYGERSATVAALGADWPHPGSCPTSDDAIAGLRW